MTGETLKSAKEFLIARDALKVDFDKKTGGTSNYTPTRSCLSTSMQQSQYFIDFLDPSAFLFRALGQVSDHNIMLRRGVRASVFWQVLWRQCCSERN